MITFDEFAKLDIRIAQVIAAEHHPDADKLLVLRISLGNEERQIVAGIKKVYTPEELVGKKIVVVANLEPVLLRGVQSDGMLLAAKGNEGIVLLGPEKEIEAGAKVS